MALAAGQNGNGKLGDGNTTDSLIPVSVLGGYTFTKVAAGFVMSCGIDVAGTLLCWGEWWADVVPCCHAAMTAAQ